MSHWDVALRSLDQTPGAIYGPESFIGYLDENGEDPDRYRTAAELSIDTRAQLADSLEQADTMVLRLGSASAGRGTQFGLVRVPERLGEFFIDEREFAVNDRQRLDYSPGGAEVASLERETREMLTVSVAFDVLRDVVRQFRPLDRRTQSGTRSRYRPDRDCSDDDRIDIQL